MLILPVCELAQATREMNVMGLYLWLLLTLLVLLSTDGQGKINMGA